MVDCGGLENRCTARYRGFESLSLRRSESPRYTAGLFSWLVFDGPSFHIVYCVHNILNVNKLG